MIDAFVIGYQRIQRGTHPIVWGLGVAMFWIVVFPTYMASRGYAGARHYAFGGILLALMFGGAAGLSGWAGVERARASTRAMDKELDELGAKIERWRAEEESERRAEAEAARYLSAKDINELMKYAAGKSGFEASALIVQWLKTKKLGDIQLAPAAPAEAAKNPSAHVGKRLCLTGILRGMTRTEENDPSEVWGFEPGSNAKFIAITKNRSGTVAAGKQATFCGILLHNNDTAVLAGMFDIPENH